MAAMGNELDGERLVDLPWPVLRRQLAVLETRSLWTVSQSCTRLADLITFVFDVDNAEITLWAAGDSSDEHLRIPIKVSLQEVRGQAQDFNNGNNLYNYGGFYRERRLNTLLRLAAGLPSDEDEFVFVGLRIHSWDVTRVLGLQRGGRACELLELVDTEVNQAPARLFNGLKPRCLVVREMSAWTAEWVQTDNFVRDTAGIPEIELSFVCVSNLGCSDLEAERILALSCERLIVECSGHFKWANIAQFWSFNTPTVQHLEVRSEAIAVAVDSSVPIVWPEVSAMVTNAQWPLNCWWLETKIRVLVLLVRVGRRLFSSEACRGSIGLRGTGRLEDGRAFMIKVRVEFCGGTELLVYHTYCTPIESIEHHTDCCGCCPMLLLPYGHDTIFSRIYWVFCTATDEGTPIFRAQQWLKEKLDQKHFLYRCVEKTLPSAVFFVATINALVDDFRWAFIGLCGFLFFANLYFIFGESTE